MNASAPAPGNAPGNAATAPSQEVLDRLHDQRRDLVAQISQSEIDTQIATAKQYPRNIGAFHDNAIFLVASDPEVAEQCYYTLKRGSRQIVGPSARFAEVLAHSYGNCRVGARVIDISDKFVTAEGIFHDLENNAAISIQTRRRITDKDGNRFNEDMIGVTANAACSIALRNAVTKGIPKNIWNPIYRHALKSAKTVEGTLESRRLAMVEFFEEKYGVSLDRVLAVVERKELNQVTEDDLADLKGIATAIKEGDTTPEDAFPQLATDDATDDDTPLETADAEDGQPQASAQANEGQGSQQEEPPAADPAADEKAEDSAGGEVNKRAWAEKIDDAVWLFAEMYQVDPTAAAVRITGFVKSVMKTTPSRITAEQQRDLVAKINTGDLNPLEKAKQT